VRLRVVANVETVARLTRDVVAEHRGGAADEEEAGRRVRTLEHAQDLGRVWARAVVEGERHLAPCRSPGAEVAGVGEQVLDSERGAGQRSWP